MPSFGQLGIGTPEATWFGTHGLSRAGLHCHIITHWTNKTLKIKLVRPQRQVWLGIGGKVPSFGHWSEQQPKSKNMVSHHGVSSRAGFILSYHS